MKAVRATIIQGSNWITELHCSTLFASRLVFGWEPRTKIPAVVDSEPQPDYQLACHNKNATKTIMKTRKDLCVSMLRPPINIDDVVLVRQQRTNKFSTRYNPKPMVVTDAQGFMITAAWKDGTSMTRNLSVSCHASHTHTQDSDIPMTLHPMKWSQ